MRDLRKTLIVKEIVHADEGRPLRRAIVRVAGLACIRNPFAGGGHVEDLSALFDVGRDIGRALAPDLVAMLGGPAVAYGKAAIVGVAGAFEHGGACIHPKLGRPMRDAIGGGKAVIPSNVKVGPVGAALDLPLGHKDDPFSFPHFDTITVALPDGPRPDEIVVVLAFADGGRPHPRVGDRPLVD
ncbi:MAG: amino acid synthesis family protein [Alphaproteobacteria bacterium]